MKTKDRKFVSFDQIKLMYEKQIAEISEELNVEPVFVLQHLDSMFCLSQINKTFNHESVKNYLSV